MAYTVHTYPQGTFSWADFVSTDMEKSRVFMQNVMGWQSEDKPTESERPDYTMFNLHGKAAAGGSPIFVANTSSHWNNYVSVDNVDEMIDMAIRLGAKLTEPATEVYASGRRATVIDPTGASISFWQPKKHIGANIVNTIGAMCWNELYTTDLAKAQQFYTKLFGWTYEADESGYVRIRNNGRLNGGMVQITKEMAEIKPCWMVYFTVQELTKSLESVKNGGGKVYQTKDVGTGKMAMIADPAETPFVIIELSVEPDEWIE